MPVISAFYAALTGLICVVLSVMVIRLRVGKRISIGDGGDKAMSRTTRVFGNFIEYAALVLVLLALAETLGTSTIWLHIFGAAFVLGRLTHAVGLGRTLDANAGRTAGMALTLGAILGLSISLLMATLPKIG